MPVGRYFHQCDDTCDANDSSASCSAALSLATAGLSTQKSLSLLQALSRVSRAGLPAPRALVHGSHKASSKTRASGCKTLASTKKNRARGAWLACAASRRRAACVLASKSQRPSAPAATPRPAPQQALKPPDTARRSLMSTSGDASRPPPPTAIVCKPCAAAPPVPPRREERVYAQCAMLEARCVLCRTGVQNPYLKAIFTYSVYLRMSVDVNLECQKTNCDRVPYLQYC